VRFDSQERVRVDSSRSVRSGGRFFGSRSHRVFCGRRSRLFYINLQLPNAASLQRTDAVARKIEEVLAKTPGVEYTTSVIGFSLLSFVRTSYNGSFSLR